MRAHAISDSWIRTTALVAAVGLATLSFAVLPAAAAIDPPAIIANGVVQLGVHPEGHLNVPGGEPSSGTGTTDVGLRYLPTGAESTAPGCLCEGWGVADAASGVSGTASVDNSPFVSNLTVESFTTTATTAVSVVTVQDTTGGDLLRVTHDYHPSASPNLYEVTVTIQNLSAATVEPRYRRVMDWDIEPTAFNEFSTIQGTAGATNVLAANDNGFDSVDPLQASFPLRFSGDAIDDGPADHGALFDFGFDDLAPGASVTFQTYYGAAGTEADADTALAVVGAEVYSYGQPSTTDGPTLGTPNTFIFAFKGVGGSVVFPAVAFSSATYEVGEAAGSATIGVALSGAATTEVTVAYASSDGTAVAPGDYTAVSGTVTIPAGSTSGSFTVPIVDDGDDEPDETVTLTLSSPTGAVLGSPATAVLTIRDDDDPTGPGNTAPSVDAGADVGGPEGSAIALDATVTDPDAGDTITSTWTYAAGAGVDAGATCSFGDASAVDTTITCTDDGSYTVTLSATDGHGPAVTDTATVTVTNVAPSVTITSPADGATIDVTLPVSVSAAYTDPGANDTHTCSIDWGDGTVADGVVASGTCSGSHAYVGGLLPTITVTVTDDDGGAGSDSIAITTVDRHTKVTGGGWIPGADGPRSKVTFGLVAQSTLSGTIQVNDHGTRSRFHGHTVTAMSGAGTTVTWSGAGRWNGADGYTFEATVQDLRKGGPKGGAVDTFAIVVRAPDSSIVFSASGGLGGGNVTVHTVR